MLSHKRTNSTRAYNIAVIRRNGLGDLLCTVPLLQYIHLSIPHASTTLFVDKRNAPLIPYLSYFENIVIFPGGNKYFSTLKTAWKFRSKRFDLAISAKTSPMKLMNIFLYTLGASNRTALVDDSWHSCLINQKIYHNPKTSLLHQALKSLHLVNPALDKIPQKLYPTIKTSTLIDKHRIYEKFLPPKFNENHSPLILISTSYNRPFSNPTEEIYLPTLNSLHKKQPLRVIISHLPKDTEHAQKLSSRLLCPSFPISTKNFSQFLSLIAASDLIFIGDGGTMHLAAALNKPQVTLFGQTRIEEWSPLSDRAICFYHPLHVRYIDKAKIIKALHHQINKFMPL